jgi:CubicO group peptidase (beta-lactamase class C family)
MLKLQKAGCLLLLACTIQASDAAPPTAAELGLMQGVPVPAEKRVTLENFMLPPYNRWAFQHLRQLQPTVEVYRGEQPAVSLESAPVDLDALEFTVQGGRKLKLATWMDEAYTDSFLVLHRGKLVYERYLNGQQPHTQHQMFSATKSFVATLALMLIDEGKLDPDKKVAGYIPELRGSAFADATVQQILDMTTSVSFSEEYTDPQADIWKYGFVFSIGGRAPADYSGPSTIHDYLPTLRKGDTGHGHGFHYVTPNTDVLGWLNSRVTGKTLEELLSERIWQRLGAERDGYLWVEGSGTPMAGGGLNITARDAARFGQMVLQKGRYNRQQVLPRAVAERILQAGNPDKFTVFYDHPWYQDEAYAYHDMWWTFDNEHKAVSAAEGQSNDTDGPQIWHQIARHLMAR